MTFILLSAEQAGRVRYSDPGKGGLDPIARTDGTYFLGLECLKDPQWGEYLARLPTGDVPRNTIKWVADEAARTAIKR